MAPTSHESEPPGIPGRFKGIKLDGATLGKVSKTIGLPESKWPEPGVSRAEDGTGKDGIAACLDYGQYWDKPKATKDG